MLRITVLPPIRWSLVWVVALVASLLAGVFAAPTAPTKAQTLDPWISVKPGSGRPNDVFDITGDGWAPGSTVYIFWDPSGSNTQIGAPELCYQCQAFDSGLQADVPYDASPDTYTIEACQWDYESQTCSSTVAFTQFTVLALETTVAPRNGRHGGKMTISGRNWPSTYPLMIMWDPDGPTSQTLAESVEPDSTGSWSVSTTVPAVRPDKYQIVACQVVGSGGCGYGTQDSVTFTVDAPVLNLSPARARAGSRVQGSGTGFLPGEPLTVYWDLGGSTERILGQTKVGARGGWRVTFDVPDLEPRRYRLVACSGVECTTLDRASRNFTLLLTPTPSPSPSPTPTPTPSPSPSVAPSISPSPEPTPTLAPVTPRPTRRPPPSPTPSPSPSAPPSPSPTPSDSPTPSAAVAAVAWADSLPGPGATLVGSVRAGGDPTPLIASMVLALLIAYLAPFPFTFFNKTVEANHETIQRWTAGAKRRWNSLLRVVTPGPIGSVRHATSQALQGTPGVGVFLIVSAFVYGFLNPAFGVNTESLPDFLGILVGLVAITIAFDLPLRLVHKRVVGDGGRLKALWWTLFVALICVSVSRLATFMPGYLYGLVITTAFVAAIAERTEGKGTFVAGLWLLALSFGAWFLLEWVRAGGVTDEAMAKFIEVALVTFIVAGVEAVVIGLLPLHFLPGYSLFHWSKLAWMPVFAIGVLAYLVILVNPVNGYVFSSENGPMILAIAFFVVFGLISILTWALFHFFGHRLAPPLPEGPSGPWGGPMPPGYGGPGGMPWYGGPGGPTGPAGGPWGAPGYDAPPEAPTRPSGPPWPVRPAAEPTWLGPPQPGAGMVDAGGPVPRFPPAGYPGPVPPYGPPPGTYAPPPYGYPPQPGGYPGGMPPDGPPPGAGWQPPGAGWQPPGGPASPWPPQPPDDPGWPQR